MTTPVVEKRPAGALEKRPAGVVEKRQRKVKKKILKQNFTL